MRPNQDGAALPYSAQVATIRSRVAAKRRAVQKIPSQPSPNSAVRRTAIVASRSDAEQEPTGCQLCDSGELSRHHERMPRCELVHPDDDAEALVSRQRRRLGDPWHVTVTRHPARVDNGRSQPYHC